MLTQERLKELLHYCPEKGLLTWISKPSKFANIKIGNRAGSPTSNGYRSVKIDNRTHQEHRLIWLLCFGHLPKYIDHINGNTLDNRLENLREVTLQENCKNCSISKNNTSGVMGVIWNKRINKWEARIKVDYKQIHLGVTSDFFEAVCLRKSAENKHGFHENHGRRKNYE